MDEEKRALRQNIALLLNSVPDRKTRETAITRQALALVKKREARRVAVFLSFKNEVCTDDLVNSLLAENVEVYAPIIDGDSMRFVRIYKDTQCSIDDFGIRKPLSCDTQNDFDLIFVPLVAFDGEHNRLGRGKGFYDRFLRTSKAYTVGLAFAEQRVSKVPTDENDVKLNTVIFC